MLYNTILDVKLTMKLYKPADLDTSYPACDYTNMGNIISPYAPDVLVVGKTDGVNYYIIKVDSLYTRHNQINDYFPNLIGDIEI